MLTWSTGCASALAIVCSAQAAAQDVGAAESVETAAEGNTIVVTGSRIRKTNYNSTEPLTIISSADITQAGFGSVSEALQSTGITQGGSQINNYYAGFVVNGGTGVNTVGLRGMAPERTLVLLNGRRIAPAGTRGAVGVADLNVLPTMIVDRIEVLKAGASSVYGSDAVAGVINIVTDDALDGLYLDAEAIVPEGGAGASQRISASYGTSGDNWHVIGSLEYYNRSTLQRRDAKWTQCPIGGCYDGTGAASGFGSGDYIDPLTGKPACFTLDNGGVTINTLGVPTREAFSRASGALGNFNRLVPDTSITTGNTPGYAGVSYYTRDTFDPRQEEEELVTPAETVTAFVSGAYDLGGAEIYAEFLGNRRKSSGTLYRQLSLDYAQGSLLIPEIFRDGAFLNPNEISNGNIIAARSFIGFGPHHSSQDVDFYRATAGVRGDLFLEEWQYDVYGSFSRAKGTDHSESFLTDRIAQSLDVVQNADGSFRCASNVAGCVAAPAISAASIGGQLSQAYRNWILADTVGTTKYREVITAASVNGPVFALPGGDAQVALGAEYRDAKLNDTPDDNSINGNLFNLSSATPTRGTDNVWEAYGEIDLPLLADMPLVESLNIGASGRYTEYASYGGDWTYKVQGEYEPVGGVRFRGSYGTSYRAPTIYEQFLGATSGFLSSSSDPCDDYANKTNSNLQANCAAIGLPADFIQTSGVNVLDAGDAASGLEAETSKNLSGGLVISPPLPDSLGQFSMSADYFAITVNNGVAKAGAENILSRCYEAPSFDPNAGFCRLVERDANNEVTVNNNYVNLATDKVKGYEFNVRYEKEIGPGLFSVNALINKYTEQSNKLFAEDALVDRNGTVDAPDWTATVATKYNVGAFTFRYGLDWVDGDKSKTYNYVATGADGVLDQDTLDELYAFYDLTTPDYFLHDFSLQYEADQFILTGGVRNAFDKKPPTISADIYDLVGNSPLYSGFDYVGRRFFASVTAKF